MSVMIRHVADTTELAHAFDMAGATMLDDDMDHIDWRFDAIRDNFARDHAVNFVAEIDDTIIGALLCFRDDGGVRLESSASLLSIKAQASEQHC